MKVTSARGRPKGQFKAKKKRLLEEICVLASNGRGNVCVASNEHLAASLKASVTQVKRYLTSLSEDGEINVVTSRPYLEEGAYKRKRKIFVKRGMDQQEAVVSRQTAPPLRQREISISQDSCVAIPADTAIEDPLLARVADDCARWARENEALQLERQARFALKGVPEPIPQEPDLAISFGTDVFAQKEEEE